MGATILKILHDPRCWHPVELAEETSGDIPQCPCEFYDSVRKVHSCTFRLCDTVWETQCYGMIKMMATNYSISDRPDE